VTLASLLYGAVLGCYFVATACYHLHVFAGSARARRLAPYALAAGVLIHAAALGQRWFDPSAPHLPVSTRVVTTIAWTVALTQLILDWRLGWSAVGSLSVPLAFCAVFYAIILPHQQALNGATLKDALVRPHLVATILGFAGLALAFCLAVVYLVEGRLLKKKQVRGAFHRLPPLESVATAAHWLAAVGFSMLTLGIITGSLVAIHKGGGWYREPKVVASFVAWLIYAAYMATSSLAGWRGQKTSYFLIGGFAALLVAYVFNLR
jgi:ABC-type uncharacterized transport system permease subunit